MIEPSCKFTCANPQPRQSRKALANVKEVANPKGAEAHAMDLINAGLGNASTPDEGRVPAMAGYATAILNNGFASQTYLLTSNLPVYPNVLKTVPGPGTPPRDASR